MSFEQWRAEYVNKHGVPPRAVYAWNAGKAAERERCLDVRLSDDDALRFACRVLESDAPEADKASARDGLMAIRVRMRGVTAPAQAAGCAPGEG
jgi:hypothetical protein